MVVARHHNENLTSLIPPSECMDGASHVSCQCRAMKVINTV